MRERFINTKIFVLLVGEHTRYLYKYVRWEIQEAIKRGLIFREWLPSVIQSLEPYISSEEIIRMAK